MYVQSLHLENIKAFDKLDIEFLRRGEYASPYTGLNVFVGGNSSGKSTLLKCIAMALSGPTVANQQLITPAGWVRRGAKRGVIELKVHWDPVYDSLRGGGKSPAGDGFSIAWRWPIPAKPSLNRTNRAVPSSTSPASF